MDTATSPRAVVSANYRDEIASYAAWLLPEPETGSAALVKVIAETLLDWVSQSAGKDDVRQRVLAMRHQKVNTPDAYRRQAGRLGYTMSSLTLEEFLAESDILYGFIAADGSGR